MNAKLNICPACNRRIAVHGGSQCQDCCDLSRSYQAKRVSDGYCRQGCGNRIDYDRSSIRCSACLDKTNKKYLENRLNVGSRMVGLIRLNTRRVSIGSSTNSKELGIKQARKGSRLLPWSHDDFKGRFGQLSTNHQIDHIVPIEVVVTNDGGFDSEISMLAASLDNLQFLTQSENCRKGFNTDRAVLSYAKGMRDEGLSGIGLWKAILSFMARIGTPHKNAEVWMQ